MICPNCSTENAAGAPVCVRCGTVLATAAGPPPPPATEVPAAAEPPPGTDVPPAFPAPGGPAFPAPGGPPADLPPPAEAASRSRGALIVAAALVVVAALGVLGFVLLKGGGVEGTWVRHPDNNLSLELRGDETFTLTNSENGVSTSGTYVAGDDGWLTLTTPANSERLAIRTDLLVDSENHVWTREGADPPANFTPGSVPYEPD